MKINKTHVASALLVGTALVIGGAFGRKWQALVAGCGAMSIGVASAIYICSKQPKVTDTEAETSIGKLKKKSTNLTSEQRKVVFMLTSKW